MTLFIDGDACPVKDECYRVAQRYGVPVKLVSNRWMQAPRAAWLEQVVVEAGADAADDWIAQRATTGDVVITADVPLAERSLKAGARVISPTGKPFTPDSIGSALASRAVGEHLRSMGEITAGARPFSPVDRSRFLQALDEAMTKARRAGAAGRD